MQVISGVNNKWYLSKTTEEILYHYVDTKLPSCGHRQAQNKNIHISFIKMREKLILFRNRLFSERRCQRSLVYIFQKIFYNDKGIEGRYCTDRYLLVLS